MLNEKKTIYLNSPQKWDESKVSKHHYAKELAVKGHTVYFIEPPDRSANIQPAIRSGPTPRLSIVTYKTFFPYVLKFHFKPAFDALMKVQAKRLVKAIGFRPNIIWDFDNSYQFNDLRVFQADLSIFHPVDDLPPGKSSIKHADLVLSNAQRYINRLKPIPTNSCVIDHGLTSGFVKYAKGVVSERQQNAETTRVKDRLVVGYVGNLDRPGIDWNTVKRAAERLPQTLFVFIGPYGVSGDGPPQSVFERGNIKFVGKKTSEEVLQIANGIDVWWMVYDSARDLDGGTNPHKLLEYLATGSVVVSNWVEAYASTDLVVMPPDQSNSGLPALLEHTLNHIKELNSFDERRRRASYTLDFSYSSQLDKIAEVARAVKDQRDHH